MHISKIITNFAAGIKIGLLYTRKKRTKTGEKTMATAIKAIPTLYGEEAMRFRQMAEDAERQYESAPTRDRKSDPYVISMRNMLQRSGMSVAL